ncbi:MAG: RagB/SusD family nutrient uptake outer membrane protein [Gemmatimonadaceae bacterium]
MRLRLLAPLALASAALFGCDRALTTSPGDRVPADQIIVDGATAAAALNGAYDALQSGSYYGLDLEMLGDLPSDNGQGAGTYQFLKEISDNVVTTDNPEITAMWTAIYRQIDRDNVVLQRVPQLTNVTDAVKNPIVGEAYLLRALGYHNLVKFWSDVPMPLVPVVAASDASAYTRTPQMQVYTQILADLDKAATMITTTDTRRANKLAVSALRSRVLFYRAGLAGNANSAADYQGALDAANVVFATMKDTLTVPFGSMFTATGTNTAEDIFRVSFTASESNSLGYYWLFSGRHEARPTANLRAAYDANDIRLPSTVGPRSATSSTLEGKKWPTTIGAEHPHVIRLAELVLIKAEVLARQNNLAGAVAEYNKVRARAGLANHVLGVDVVTQQNVMDAILKERRRELALEGDRWPDLVRLGLAVTVKSLQARPQQALFPIPFRDISTTPGLTQNPGY